MGAEPTETARTPAGMTPQHPRPGFCAANAADRTPRPYGLQRGPLRYSVGPESLLSGVVH